jgi:hypothetical protein
VKEGAHLVSFGFDVLEAVDQFRGRVEGCRLSSRLMSFRGMRLGDNKGALYGVISDIAECGTRANSMFSKVKTRGNNMPSIDENTQSHQSTLRLL